MRKDKAPIAKKIFLKIYYQIYRIIRIPIIFFYSIILFFKTRILKKGSAICLVVDQLGEGGLEQVVMDLYNEFRRQGTKSYVISVNDYVSDYIDQLEDDPRHFRMIKRSTIDFLRFCIKNNIGTIHYHFSTFRIPLMKVVGMKIIYTVHNTYVWFSKKSWMYLRLKLMFCDHIVAVSNFVRNYFIKKTGFKKTSTILNGIDLERFNSALQGDIELYSREDFGFLEEDIVIVMASSFTEQKYHMSLLGAMKRVAKINKNIKLLFCGPIIDRPLYRIIKKEIKSMKLDHSIIIHDKIPQSRMHSFLRNIPDAVILPSLYEGGVPPLSIIEALSCGVPALMTDLDLSSTIFDEYITKIKPACNDISTIRPSDLRQRILNKNPINLDDIVDKILSVKKKVNVGEIIPKKILNEIDLKKSAKSYLKLN